MVGGFRVSQLEATHVMRLATSKSVDDGLLISCLQANSYRSNSDTG